MGAPRAGFAPGTGRGRGSRRESWVSVTSRVLGSHRVKFGFVAELGDHGDPRLSLRGLRGALRSSGQ